MARKPSLPGILASLAFTAMPGRAAAESPIPQQAHFSTVARNGMPKEIVKPGARWNFGPGSLWTHQGWQYAAYWDDARRVSIARRQLPDGPWSTISLPGYQRTENLNRGKGGAKSQGFGDGHEKVVMGISPDGFIHLAFDHHLSTLHYRVSKEAIASNPSKHPWHPDLFGPVQDNLGGPMIDLVTYPNFTTDGTRFTLYLRLNGGSGSADSHLFSYADGQWLSPDPAATKLIDKNWSGGDKTVNAYPHSLVMQGNRQHLTWCWRDTPDPKTCHDLCYAYSDDHGHTWRNNDGQIIARLGKEFITADSPGIAVWKIPPGTHFVNGGSMTVDKTGRVHVLMRGENGKPTYFIRDPENKKWSRRETSQLASLVSGKNGLLYLVSENGLSQTSAQNFGEIALRSHGNRPLFDDSTPSIDRSRGDQAISIIGQSGNTISVIDYPLGQK